MQNVARRLCPHPVQVDAQTAQHVDGNAFTLAHKTQQQMLGADVMMTHEAGLIHGQFDHAFGPRRQRGFAKRRPFAPSHRPFDGADHLTRFDAEFTQYFHSNTVLLAHKAEQQVLRSNIVVI